MDKDNSSTLSEVNGDWNEPHDHMSPISDLDKLDRQLKETSARIEYLKSHVQNIEQNIALLKSLEQQLRQNLSVLKDQSVVASASEFKKVKQDLQTVLESGKDATLDLKNNKVFLDSAEKLLIELKGQYDSIVNNQEHKVIPVRFGKQDT